MWISSFIRAETRMAGAQEGQNRRAVTVADAIEMTRLGGLGYSWIPDHVAQFSPDRSKFVVILRKGKLEENTNEYSILMWLTGQVFDSSRPRVLLTMTSSSNREAIKDVTWLPDNETLIFLGEQPGELQQLYSFDVTTDSLRRIASHDTNILSYSISSHGDQIAYTAEEPLTNILNTSDEHTGFAVSDESLPDLILNQAGGSRSRHHKLFYARTSSGQFRAIDLPFDFDDEAPILSPNGRYIAIAAKAPVVPAWWKEYSDPIVHNLAAQYLMRGQESALERYIVIDTRTGDHRVLLNTPLPPHGAEELQWSPDSQYAAISGVYLPLDTSEGNERAVRRERLFSVAIDVTTGALSTVSGEDLKLVAWDSRSQDLIFQPRSEGAGREPVTKIIYRRKGGQWSKEQLSGHVEPLTVTLEQDMNHPPRVYAVDTTNNRRALLVDLNPQFDKLNFARVEEVTWAASDGHLVTGGLYYPIDYKPGEKYPLVIQTHGWSPKAFWVDGPFTTAFAAQPLAAKNIAVLQMDEDYPSMLTANELPREMASIEGAIDYLSKRGLIDPQRVGLIAFSRTCFHVKYFLTHSRYHVAAASVSDGLDGGYFQYIAFSNANASVASSSEAVIGGPPFGVTLKQWLEISPSFSIDKVQTPLRIVAPGPAALIGEWEWFVGLSRLGRPVELIYMQEGDHILQKPYDRMLSQEGNVEWFAFWLKGERGGTNDDQYSRWLKLRDKAESASARSLVH
jgi:dipeptidyl aminopeptidase/acylaminoacyl peptidase